MYKFIGNHYPNITYTDQKISGNGPTGQDILPAPGPCVPLVIRMLGIPCYFV